MTELVSSVGGGYPTIVYPHIVSIPTPNRYWSEGIKPLDKRQIILSRSRNLSTNVKVVTMQGGVTLTLRFKDAREEVKVYSIGCVLVFWILNP